MAENEGSLLRASSAPLHPTIMLPPRSLMESLFTGGPGVSPGPMTLVSNFFSENDPDSDCRSFSQLLARAMASPALVPEHMVSFSSVEADSSSKDKDSGGGREIDLRFK
ncbi:WRKY Transcription Factor [Sarracenia purpurea var. burkii]